MPQHLVNLDEDFSAPIPRAQLKIFLLLADAVRPILSDLCRVLRDEWHEVIAILAKIVAEVLPSMIRASQVHAIWSQFLADARIVTLPKRAIVVLNMASARLAPALISPGQSLKYLDRANDEASVWIRALGESRNVSIFTQVAKVPIRVYFDPGAEQYCASSSLLAREIGWKLQLVEYAWYGALIPDLLLEHEYISHLLPRNQSLSQKVREIWLNVALLSAHQNTRIDPHRQHVNLYLWRLFRDELLQHKGRETRVYGSYTLESKASIVAFYNPQVFWQLTSAILELKDDEGNAAFVDDLFAQIASCDDAKLRRLLGLRWTDLSHFAKAARNLLNC